MAEQLEQIRKEGMKKMLIAGAFIVLIFILILIFSASYGVGTVFVIGLCVSVIVLSCIYGSVKKKYVAAYKELYLRDMLEQEFEEVTVDFENGFSEEQIAKGHLLTLHERFYSNDYVSAKLYGIPFECSDVHIQDVVRSGKHTSVVTRFQGLYMMVPLKKKFTSWLVVREKEFLDNGNPREWLSDMPELEKIEVEDERFNELYSIYASDGTEAFYLLTPAFIEKLIDFEKRFEGRCYFGFWNQKMHIAIDDRKEHFELSLMSSVDEHVLYHHRTEVLMIKEIIELIQKECEGI